MNRCVLGTHDESIRRVVPMPRGLKFVAPRPIFFDVPIKPQPTCLRKVFGWQAVVVSRWVRRPAARQDEDPRFAGLIYVTSACAENAANEQIAVVVSARGKSTDELEHLLEQAANCWHF